MRNGPLASAPKRTVRHRAIILTALRIERRSVLRHLNDVRRTNVRGTLFTEGDFGDWKIAVAEVGPGNPRAAATADRAITHFKPQIALFVGVAGGLKDVRLGDVVVGTKVYGYEAGKESAGKFRPRPEVFLGAYEL